MQLQEHESPKSEEKSKEYQPTPEERKTKKLVDKLLSEAKKYRSKYDHKWLDYYKFFRGNQWPSSRPSYLHAEVFNFVFQVIQSYVPVLMDRQPRIDFIPVEPQDQELADILSQLIDYDWRKNNWSSVVIEALYDSHIYGTSYASMCGKMEKGKGVIEFESEDVFYCFPDPSSKNVNKGGEYFIIAKPINIRKAKKKYQKYAEYIKKDLVDFIGGDKTDLGKARFQSPVDKKSAIESSRDSSDPGKNEALEVILYIKDDSIVEEKENGKYIQKKKFPHGRKIVQCGGIIVEDNDYPYDDWEDRFAPFARLQNYVLPREFYGISEIEQIEGPQKVFNKLISFTLDVLTLMGNPVWIVDSSAGIDTDSLTNRPGLIIEKQSAGEVRRVEGAQLQPYVLSIIDRVEKYFNDISGSSDVSRGVKPEGVNAASAIRALQDASQTRLRLKGQLLDMFLQEIGQMYLSRVFQFYTTEKIFRITNDENVNKFFKISTEPMVDEDGINQGYQVKVNQVAQSDNGAVIESNPDVYKTQGKFDVLSSIGSGLPFAKAERATNAFQLFDRQIVDAEAVLDDIDYPNKEKVLNRLREQQMAAQQAQAQQQTMQQPQQGMV